MGDISIMKKPTMAIFAQPLREAFESRGLKWGHVFTNRGKLTSNVKFYDIGYPGQKSIGGKSKTIAKKLKGIMDEFDFIGKIEYRHFNQERCRAPGMAMPSVVVHIERGMMLKSVPTL
jgi:hypothetical protein